MSDETPKPKRIFEVEEPIIRTHDRAGLTYQTTTGRMPLRNENHEIEAQIFYVAYTLGESVDVDRPLMFCFNGGPGSPAIWLHLGTIGPRRIHMKDDGLMPEPPYHLQDNPLTWLQAADLVFVDPVGTGYSEALDKETSKKFWGMKGDVDSLCEFIRLYLAKAGRSCSPLYYCGESYGTTRGVAIVDQLQQKGVVFNGISLISTAMSFLPLVHYPNNDLSYALLLPTYAATAFYHGKIPVRGRSLRAFLKKVEAFAEGEYTTALMQGSRLSARDHKAVRKKLAGFTGLSEDFLDRVRLRIPIHEFCKELRRDEGLTVGRLDSRIAGVDLDQNASHVEHDPSMTAIWGPYGMAFDRYVRAELGYESDRPYEVFHGVSEPWKWDQPEAGPPDTSECLARAIIRNPYLKVYIANGLYDLATPYFATEYVLDHLAIPSSLRVQINVSEFEAGHMMYSHEGCNKKLSEEMILFINDSKTK